MSDLISFDEYRIYLNYYGIYDMFDIKLQYKLYLAIQTGDEETIRKQMNSYYYDMYYKAIGRLN